MRLIPCTACTFFHVNKPFSRPRSGRKLNPWQTVSEGRAPVEVVLVAGGDPRANRCVIVPKKRIAFRSRFPWKQAIFRVRKGTKGVRKGAKGCFHALPLPATRGSRPEPPLREYFPPLVRGGRANRCVIVPKKRIAFRSRFPWKQAIFRVRKGTKGVRKGAKRWERSCSPAAGHQGKSTRTPFAEASASSQGRVP